MSETYFTFLKAPAALPPTRVRRDVGLLAEPPAAPPGRVIDPWATQIVPQISRPYTDSDGATTVIQPRRRPLDRIANSRINIPGTPDREEIVRRPLPPGHMLHKYEIQRVIGEGGFALTYEAIEPTLGRTVAIKELFWSQLVARSDSGDEVYLIDGGENQEIYEWIKFSFSKEAQISSKMRHDNVVRMLEFFKKNNTAYIVFEHLNGDTLYDWREARLHKLNQAETMRFIDQTARALSYLHRAKILHRDIKPKNVIINRSDSVPILIDFGSAVEIGSQDQSLVSIVSTGFSPPELYRLDGHQDERSDIYSYCATIYWMLSGRQPQKSTRRLAHDELAPLQNVFEPPFGQSERLYGAVMRGLNLEPNQRQRSVAEFLDDIFPKVVLARSGYEPLPRGDRIFLSYRRSDSEYFSGRLLDFLELRFGSGTVFFDIESIPVGVDHWDHIKGVLSECAVMLLVIGPRWLAEVNARQPRWYRFSTRTDFVAMEIAAAAELKLPIIPVLFDGVAMPSVEQLPKKMAFINGLNASLISDGKAFRSGADSICDQIAKLITGFKNQ